MASSSVRSDVYTALAFVALIILAIGVGYAWFELHAQTGSWNPLAGVKK
ncbi:MAG: hypothetical protein AAGA57_04300 [Planctomycetota bacterium]